MNKKHFYDHLISINSIEIELNNLGVPEKEKIELLSLAQNTIHYTVLDIALTNIKEEHKKEFVKHVNSENHEKAWELLKEKADGIEEKIRKAANQLIEELISDIKNLK
ncbi:MAG TPA: hypothetical protein VFD45_01550 [Patescibacteria group bacterium]|nr:hypothetical protein [Patescibacteria group bacterium]